MRLSATTWTHAMIAGVCLLLALVPVCAQQRHAANVADDARRVLIEKAHTLESRGRPDMAIQIWQQVLLSDPKNQEALVGAAKDYKLIGQPDKAAPLLDRLRAINPNDPNIARINAMTSTRTQNDKLREAGELARQGKNDEAMAIYRQLYDGHPPDGDIALAYYQTLYGTANGKDQAVAAMRELAQRNPGDTRFAIELGTMLTYQARTRAEGIHILEQHSKDGLAQQALRQALMWDAANPSSAAQLRQYLKEHPQDSEIAGHLKENEGKLAEMNAGIARNPAERAAYEALNSHHLDVAEKRFLAILEAEPTNGRADAGMGFIRMQQNNFGGAISYLGQAEENGFKERIVENALETSRFWYTMGEATQAVDDGLYDEAQAKYQAALAMRAHSPEALSGLAGLLIRQQQYPAAAGVYEQLVKAQPANEAGWRGLFLSYARDGDPTRALAVVGRMPAGIHNALGRDPEYLRTLAEIYQKQGRTEDARKVLATALSLPMPKDGATLQAGTRLQYAGILMEAKRYDQAAALDSQILEEDPNNVAAWMGLVSAHHGMNQDTLALSDVQKMPPTVYEQALTDVGFLSMIGAIYQQANQFDVAESLLERAARMQMQGGQQPSLDMQLQLASLYLRRNDTARAYTIYRQALNQHPDRIDAWKGLIATLQATDRNTEALRQIEQIPPAVRKQLEQDWEFVEGEASMYASTGDTAHAAETMRRVQQHYVELKQPMPPNVDVQYAWVLYNTKADRALYQELMHLGARKDLDRTQREAVQTIWASWSVRRASTAMENGNTARAMEILESAAQAFPDNLTVRKAVAGGYARVGRARDAVNLFKTVPMQDASAGDFQGAVGAALAASDKTLAEQWLRQALERFPADAGILQLAARYEQARGDAQRAADFYRASLAAMPKTNPANRLAHELAYPDQDPRAIKARTPAELAQLLNPSDEPFQKTTHLPTLPAYGADPEEGSAPVVLGRNVPQQPVFRTPPATDEATDVPVPAQKQDRPSTMTGQMRLPAVPQNIFAAPAPQPVYAQPRPLADALNPDTAPVQTPNQTPVEQPHSMAGDAYKGLLFSLMSSDRNVEALEQLNQIPADVRQQLESDVEFEQALASLYAATGDQVRSASYLARVEDYYRLHHQLAPAGIELQTAWLYYNNGDDRKLYGLLSALDQRSDLTTEQRQQVQTIWGNWSARRASKAADSGNLPLAAGLLDAAQQQYPDNPNVRTAVAGGYVKMGRNAEALEIYKSMKMDEAKATDFQGAIAAAIGAGDMAQAETWLRIALERFPSDPGILTAAARFEQARGNSPRATDFWRAALAAMPAGSSLRQYDTPTGSSYPQTQPGNLKQMLNPDNTAAPIVLPQQPGRAQLSVPQPRHSSPAPRVTASLADDLPLPVPSFSVPVQLAQNTNPASANNAAQNARSAPAGAHRSVRVLSSRAAMPGIDENGHTTDLVATGTSVGMEQKPALSAPAPAVQMAAVPDLAPAPALDPKHPSRLPEGVRITAAPVNPLVAQAQEQLAQQTDPQLSAGSAANIRPIPAKLPTQVAEVHPPSVVTYSVTQYTPSAQEAATGAYSAPHVTQSAPQPTEETKPARKQKPIIAPLPPTPAVQQALPAPKPVTVAKAAPKPTRKKPANTTTLANAPRLSVETRPADTAQDGLSYQPPVPETTRELPEAPQQQSADGLSDEELQQRNLPPLRGPWVRIQRDKRKLSPRDEAEMQLRTIESSFSAWMGASGTITSRSGDLGFDRMAALEAPFEASVPLGYAGRLTLVARPVFLDSGQADGNSVITVQQQTTAGTTLKQIPQPIGTLTATDTTPPAQQNAAGIGGELQLAFKNFAIAGGYTPYGFLVGTPIGRLMWRPGNGPITINLTRDSVKDTQLSYAGLRDPSGNTLGNEGQVWGGVVATGGTLQFAKGDAQSGFYMAVGGQALNGYKVEDNMRYDGSGGAYWRVWSAPEYGTLHVGANFFGMHYQHNEDAFTYGMGGYFSPQAYFLANAPFSWDGHYNTNWHYDIMGSLGVQAFETQKTPLWPLIEDSALETGLQAAALPAKTSVGPNYDFRSHLAYQVGPHWFVGGFLTGNNSRNYGAVSAGFSIRYLFRAQPSTAAGPTGLFPADGLRPYTVP